MKTPAKTLLTSLLAAVVLSALALTSAAADKNLSRYTVSAPMDFTKVVITGNARVELVQSRKQYVAVYDGYNNQHTTIVQKGDKLIINSNESEPVNIIVYLKDLHRIDASNTAIVTTKGKFSLNVLQVFLKDSARAYVNAETGSLYTVIKDRSDLKLKGATADHVLAKSKVAKINMDQFAALKLTEATLDGQIMATNYKPSISLDTAIADNIKIK